MINVNSKYLAMRGSTSDVGGKIFDTSNRNTTSDSKILIPSVTLTITNKLVIKNKPKFLNETKYFKYLFTCFSWQVKHQNAKE